MAETSIGCRILATLFISFRGETTYARSPSLCCRRSARKLAPYVTIECYCDDNSDPRREKYYACGGLLGTSDQWDALDALWSLETHELQEPFRATECECGHEQFEDWPRAKRNDLMRRLTGIIYRRNLYGFASIVPLEAYKEVFPDCGKHDAFLLAATQTIMNMAYIALTMRKDAALSGLRAVKPTWQSIPYSILSSHSSNGGPRDIYEVSASRGSEFTGCRQPTWWPEKRLSTWTI
jgi:hypothetical protein